MVMLAPLEVHDSGVKTLPEYRIRRQVVEDEFHRQPN